MLTRNQKCFTDLGFFCVIGSVSCSVTLSVNSFPNENNVLSPRGHVSCQQIEKVKHGSRTHLNITKHDKLTVNAVSKPSPHYHNKYIILLA